MKRVFGKVEAIFDIFYLAAAGIIGLILLIPDDPPPARLLAGGAAILLAGGDAFHLVPRIRVAFTEAEEPMAHALGKGKQIASITMTLFYAILWHVGILLFDIRETIPLTLVIWSLAALRILFCLSYRNRWEDRYPPFAMGIRRNIPFVAQGAMVAALFAGHRNALAGLTYMWLAILLSFLFYLPVVLLSNRIPKVGMLMLPKTCMYLWMLAMLLHL